MLGPYQRYAGYRVWDLGVRKGIQGNIGARRIWGSLMESQKEKKMEHDMQAGVISLFKEPKSCCHNMKLNMGCS